MNWSPDIRIAAWRAFNALAAGLLLAFFLAAPASGKDEAADPVEAFFDSGVIPRLRIEISPEEWAKLEKENRSYARATVWDGDKFLYTEVGIHMKGAAGSFRGLGDRPALTLNFDRFRDEQKFHGLDKLHLNNSVQDPTYLNEFICAELFRAAGVPAPRVGHARVWLNGRDLGLYVLKEGFDTAFLRRGFGSDTGNFYDGGFVQGVDAPKSKKSGKGPDDQSDLKALTEAAREPDPTRRWDRLGKVLETDRFLIFLALERLTCHWDGYSGNRNNYRIYDNPKTGLIVFMAAGMDQMFGDPNFDLYGMNCLVGGALLQTPQGRALYQERLTTLSTNLFTARFLTNRLEGARARIRPVIAEMNPQWAKDHDNHVNGLRDRILARIKVVNERLFPPAPPGNAAKFAADGTLRLNNWQAKAETGTAKLAEQTGKQGEKLLEIRAEQAGAHVASWRTTVLLAAGRYRFEGRVFANGVSALKDGQPQGAGLRTSGAIRQNQFTGTTGWQNAGFDFEVPQPAQEVTLVCELRAEKGVAFFDRDSLRVVKR